MCTYPPSNNPTGISGLVNTIFDTPALELKDQKKEVMASELFSSLQHIFKSWDYRCLVPYSHKDPEKWRTYDMHGFRAASNQEMFDKVDTFKFQVLFNNWINPKVLAKYAKRPRKAWKRAYGFPYTTPVNWNGTDINTADASPCWWRCAQLVNQISLIVFCPTFFQTCHLKRRVLSQETEDFAKNCAKEGGYFKCCVTMFTLNIFEDARNRLIQEKLRFYPARAPEGPALGR